MSIELHPSWRLLLRTRRYLHRKRPTRWRLPGRNALYVAFINLDKTRIAVAANVPVIRRPIEFGGNLAKFPARLLAEQTNSIVVGTHLRVIETLVQNQSAQCLAFG